MARDAKHLIIGTAGHVDHGKTTLIHALTGINPDRLKEEQERGLTIDLGFAWLTLPSGRAVSIIDVPGHERFLKNMLAGAYGVDIVLLVVAADEGVMPQTREHIEILELLESRQGVVALTKSDMVEDDWLEVVEDDLRDELAKTFLKGSKIIRVSGITGQGIPELAAELDRLADAAESKPTNMPFRLPIDRVFTMTGFGTVITGTLVSGELKVGDAVRILPAGINSRVRGIEVHEKKQDVAYAGTRVAVNLAGVEMSDIGRGDVILSPGYLQASHTLDAFVRVLEDAPRPLANRTRVRLHIGSAEVIGRAIVLGGNEIAPGGKGFVQLALEHPVVSARGDRFVLRFFSPMDLVGGGIVLDPAAHKHKAHERNLIERLEHKLRGDPVDLVEDTLLLREAGSTADELAKQTGLALTEVKRALTELTKADKITSAGDRLIHRAAIEALTVRAGALLQSYFEANPMKSAMAKEEFRRLLGPSIDPKGFPTILSLLSDSGAVEISETAVKLPGRVPSLSDKDQQFVDRIERVYSEAGVNPPIADDLEQKLGAKAKEATALLVERGLLVRIAPDLFFHRQAIENAQEALTRYLEERKEMTVAEFRDLIGSSRKYVVPLLEYFDKTRVTERVGVMRVLAR